MVQRWFRLNTRWSVRKYTILLSGIETKLLQPMQLSVSRCIRFPMPSEIGYSQKQCDGNFGRFWPSGSVVTGHPPKLSEVRVTILMIISRAASWSRLLQLFMLSSFNFNCSKPSDIVTQRDTNQNDGSAKIQVREWEKQSSYSLGATPARKWELKDLT